jgi:hypothetical protein
MGYTTSFNGRLKFNRELTVSELRYYEKFIEDGFDDSQKLIGDYGGYCQWEITKDGKGLEWDGGEKFYGYIAWLKFVLDCILGPWGVVANGELEWDGEEQGDVGLIKVEDNLVKIKRKKLVWLEITNED